MTAFAVNILALLIVLGLCWGAMLWLSGRFHGHATAEFEFETVEFRDDMKITRRSVIDPDGVIDQSVRSTKAPCITCEGVGATNLAGRVEPCPQCYGTGIVG